jgi:hypothetical protein
VLQCLPRKHEALSSNPNSAKGKKRKRGKEGGREGEEGEREREKEKDRKKEKGREGGHVAWFGVVDWEVGCLLCAPAKDFLSSGTQMARFLPF